MNSSPKFFRVSLIALLILALVCPALAQRGNKRRSGAKRSRVQRSAPKMRRAAPRRSVRRSAPRRSVRRSAPRRSVRRSAPRRSVKRSAPRRAAKRSAPRRQARRSAPRTKRKAEKRSSQRMVRAPQKKRAQKRQQRRSAQRKMKKRPGRRMPTAAQTPRKKRRKAAFAPQKKTRNASWQNKRRRKSKRANTLARPHRNFKKRSKRRRVASYAAPRHPNARPARVRRPGRRAGARKIRRNKAVAVNQTRQVQVNRNVNVNRNVVVRQPYRSNRYRPDCAPVYTSVYNPTIYSNYNVRRYYRPRYRRCYIPFLSLGFYVARPYRSYNYARVDYNEPFIYGDESAYQPAPESASIPDETGTGGPVADAISEEGRVAAAPTSPSSTEEAMLSGVSEYVASRSIEERFQLADAAFQGQSWSLELAQAPAVFEIDADRYSVVAGFEGTLGDSSVPSNVVVEFFVAKEGDDYEVKSAWITSANGIPRNKLFQSPVYSDVKTWQPGLDCPFTGQPMVPVPSDDGSEHG